MKKTIMIIIIFTFSVVLTACSNADSNSESEVSSQNIKEQQKDAITGSVTNEEDESTEEEESSEVFEVTLEDQLDLEIGDTGTFDTTLGTYEMT